MNLSLEGLELDPADFEDADEKTKQLAEIVSELLDVLKISFKSL